MADHRRERGPAIVVGALRCTSGVSFIVAPDAASVVWGSDPDNNPTAALLLRLMGYRDASIGGMLLRAGLRNDPTTAGRFLASAGADLADLIGGLANHDRLPDRSCTVGLAEPWSASPLVCWARCGLESSASVPAMPSDFQLKTMNAVHRVVLKLSFGHLGWNASNMPVLELTTIGRKSGQPLLVTLTSPVQEGSTHSLIVASRGGDDQHPAWFLNLRDNPDVEATMKGEKRAMRAEIVDATESACCGRWSRRITRTTPGTRRRPTARSRWCCCNPVSVLDAEQAVRNAHGVVRVEQRVGATGRGRPGRVGG